MWSYEWPLSSACALGAVVGQALAEYVESYPPRMAVQVQRLMAKPGRPPLDSAATQPSAAVHLKLPARDYDRADQLRQRGESIQDLIRQGLKRLLDERGNRI